MRGKGRYKVNKESTGGTETSSIVASHWLSCDDLLLAEFLVGKKRKSSFFLLGFIVIEGCEGSPFWPHDSILIEIMLINFHKIIEYDFEPLQLN